MNWATQLGGRPPLSTVPKRDWKLPLMGFEQCPLLGKVGHNNNDNNYNNDNDNDNNDSNGNSNSNTNSSNNN